MIGPGGRIKIVDFGIARVVAASRSVTFIGSLHYMSPEQLTLAPLDARSDIFAVGAVLYELLSFQRAFPAESIDGLIQQVRFGSPLPLAQQCPGLAPDLIAVVERALQKSPEDRFPDSRMMERALRSVLRGVPADEDLSSQVTCLVPGNDDVAAAGSEETITKPAAPTRWRSVQSRLLDAKARRDYGWFALLGAAPMVAAIAIGADVDRPVVSSSRIYEVCLAVMGGEPIVQGYASRLNWWPYFIYLPFALFAMRHTASRLFPSANVRSLDQFGILQKISARGRATVAGSLAAAATDPRNLRIVLGLSTIMTLIDSREILAHYVGALNGAPVACPRELDWTVAFLAGTVAIEANALLVAVAYTCQFVMQAIGLMAVGLLFRHNLFYLDRIYRRHRGSRYPLTQQMLLEFDDVERCFGMRVLNSTFNFQVLILIVGGMLFVASRMMNVDATPLGIQYEAALTSIVGGAAPPSPVVSGFGFADLFPDAGQVMLAAAWMVCFVIVAMPSLVKFLPLLDKRLTLMGRRDYLLQFIPPTTDVQTDTPEAVDRLARKFARNSFWPAGDERARTLYTVAYFVFVIVIVPVPPTSNVVLIMHVLAVFALAHAGMKFTFWLFRKALMNIDATLAES